MRHAFVALAVLASSCTLPQVVPEALNTEFKPTGEVLLYDRTASFDAVRVRSPRINLAQRTDGSWGGVLADRPIDVTVTDKTVRGVEFTLSREASEGNRLVITGQFQGRIYRFEFDDEKALIRGPTTSMNLQNRFVSARQTTYGPQQNLVLRGEAGAENPPWPQFGFALMAMLQ